LEACHIPDLQNPGQRRNRTHSGNCSQPLQPLRQQRVALQRTDQRIVQLLRSADRLTAQLQQRPDTVVDLLVVRHQIGEVTHLVQPPLGMSHTFLQKQPRYAVLHLNHLLNQQPTVAQRSAPVPDLSRGHMALRQKITTKAVGYLTGIDLVVLPLRRGDSTQHQRMCHLHLFRVRNQVIVNPAGEDRRFHGDHPGLRQRLDPAVQLPPG
jgi:hypothetical protein